MALSMLDRLVLNVSKYLIRLPNTSAKDHQWIEGLRVYEASLVVPTIGRSADARGGGEWFASAPESRYGSKLPRAPV